MSDRSGDSRELIRRALGGDEESLDELFDEISSPIHRSVACMLRRWRKGASSARQVRQEVEDLVQEVLLHLFEKDGKALLAWDPAVADLTTYVGHIARSRAAMVLRSPRSPWREHPVADDAVPEEPDSANPEHEAAVRDLWRQIYLCLAAKFKPRDFLLFRQLVVGQEKAKAAAEQLGEKLNNIHKWLSRIRGRARDCREHVMKRMASEATGPEAEAADD